MFWLVRFLRTRLTQYLFLIIAVLVIYSYSITRNHYCSRSNNDSLSNPRNESKFDRYCQEIDEQIRAERPSHTPIQLNPSEVSIPYFYSQWRSSALMPRAITSCEHA